jgi:alkylation response protein AidB-like acyl-CoA dehydrogenase
MHSFSLAGLLALAATTETKDSVEWMLLQGLAENKLLVASGFAEGKSGQGLFAPAMQARRSGENWILSGKKQPCSLSHSMDLMATSCALHGEDGTFEGYAIAVVSSQLPGVEVEPFWSAPVLTGAQSEAVVLRDVEVHDELMIRMGEDDGTGLDDLQTIGVVWFELLMTASYIGAASALVERVLAEGKSDVNSKVAVACELEAAMAALESVGHEIDAGHDVTKLALRSVLCRYAAQDSISRAVASSVEQLGGMAFIQDSDVGYLAAATHALAFHPPPKLRSGGALLDALQGSDLMVD